MAMNLKNIKNWYKKCYADKMNELLPVQAFYGMFFFSMCCLFYDIISGEVNFFTVFSGIAALLWASLPILKD